LPHKYVEIYCRNNVVKTMSYMFSIPQSSATLIGGINFTIPRKSWVPENDIVLTCFKCPGMDGPGPEM